MKFKVERTSIWNGEKPCEEAYEGEIQCVDVRNFKTFEEFEEKFGKSFLDFGTNHRITKYGIARDTRYKKCWYVDIDTIEDLLLFKEKYGEIIIGTAYEDNKTPMIEIYDDYRE